MLLFGEFFKKAKGTSTPAPKQLYQASFTFGETFKAVSSHRADLNAQQNVLDFCMASLPTHRILSTSLSEGAVQFLAENNIHGIGTHAQLRESIQICERSLENARQALIALGNMNQRNNGFIKPNITGTVDIHKVWPPSDPNGTKDVVQQIVARRKAIAYIL